MKDLTAFRARYGPWALVAGARAMAMSATKPIATRARRTVIPSSCSLLLSDGTVGPCTPPSAPSSPMHAAVNASNVRGYE